jgi:hypothetical protein
VSAKAMSVRKEIVSLQEKCAIERKIAESGVPDFGSLSNSEKCNQFVAWIRGCCKSGQVFELESNKSRAIEVFDSNYLSVEQKSRSDRYKLDLLRDVMSAIRLSYYKDTVIVTYDKLADVYKAQTSISLSAVRDSSKTTIEQNLAFKSYVRSTYTSAQEYENSIPTIVKCAVERYVPASTMHRGDRGVVDLLVDWVNSIRREFYFEDMGIIDEKLAAAYRRIRPLKKKTRTSISDCNVGNSRIDKSKISVKRVRELSIDGTTDDEISSNGGNAAFEEDDISGNVIEGEYEASKKWHQTEHLLLKRNRRESEDDMRLLSINGPAEELTGCSMIVLEELCQDILGNDCDHIIEPDYYYNYNEGVDEFANLIAASEIDWRS